MPLLSSCLGLRWHVALAAAALYERAMPAGAVLERAADAIGAEFEKLAARGTARRATIGDQRAPGRGTVRVNSATRTGFDARLAVGARAPPWAKSHK